MPLVVCVAELRTLVISALGEIWFFTVPFCTGSCNGKLQFLENTRLKFGF